MPSSRQAGRIACSMPREISEYSICRSQIGCDGRGAADRLGADLGEADVADVAGLHQLGDRADGLLDRHVGVQARRAVDVDVVDAEARERVGERGLDRGRARVVAEPRAVGAALRAELDAQQ